MSMPFFEDAANDLGGTLFVAEWNEGNGEWVPADVFFSTYEDLDKLHNDILAYNGQNVEGTGEFSVTYENHVITCTHVNGVIKRIRPVDGSAQ